MKFFTLLAGLALTIPVFAAKGGNNNNNNNQEADNAVENDIAEQQGNATAIDVGNNNNVTDIAENLGGINIDNNNLEQSLQDNIGQLMFNMGICNFNSQQLGGIGVGNQVQLLLQLQQLQQLQSLGLVNNFGVNNIIQQNLLQSGLNIGNLGLFKREIQDVVRKNTKLRRSVYRKRQSQKCASGGSSSSAQ